MAEKINTVSNDSLLLAGLIAGDFKAFGVLYHKYHQPLYTFALRLSKNRHEAEELVQTVFVKVWESRQAVEPDHSFSSYLFRIAQNRFYDMLRKRVVETCYAEYITLQETSVTDDLYHQIEDAETQEIIRNLLEKLPERRRQIFQLNRYENLTYKQIAEQLQISENTVDTQIRHVLNFLRKELPKYLTTGLLFLITNS